MWKTIYQANSAEELEAPVIDYQDIPPGTPVKIRLEMQPWAPIGKLADMAGAEWWVPKLVQADVTDVDVYGDWHWIVIEGRAIGAATALIIAAIAGFVATYGLSVYLVSVVLQADIEEAKLEQTEKWLREGYTPEQVSTMLRETRPAKADFMPDLSAPAIAGIGTSTILLVGLGLFLLLRK